MEMGLLLQVKLAMMGTLSTVMDVTTVRWSLVMRAAVLMPSMGNRAYAALNVATAS
jgi:hypothetical protein